MNYENSKQLSEERFKRLLGVKRATFEAMLDVLKAEYLTVHSRHNGRIPKMSLEDSLVATLQYLREYRTYEQIAADFGVLETTLIRRSHWVEDTLIQAGFTIDKGKISENETVIIDATEIRINRPQKNNS